MTQEIRTIDNINVTSAENSHSDEQQAATFIAYKEREEAIARVLAGHEWDTVEDRYGWSRDEWCHFQKAEWLPYPRAIIEADPIKDQRAEVERQREWLLKLESAVEPTSALHHCIQQALSGNGFA